MCGRYATTSSPEAIRALFRYDEHAEFPGALQHRADPADRDRAHRERQAPLCAGALGPAAVLGQGPEDVRAADQCARRIRARQAGLQECDALPALPDPGRRLLRMEARRRAASSPITRTVRRRPVAFAGLWESWTGPNGEELETAAIVTTRANRRLAALHDRMPVVVPPEAFDLWLDCAKVDARDRGGADRAMPGRCSDAASGLAGRQSRAQRQSATRRSHTSRRRKSPRRLSQSAPPKTATSRPCSRAPCRD